MGTFAFEGHLAAVNHSTALTHCAPSCNIDGAPEVFDVRMCSPPRPFQLLDFLVGEALRFEHPESIQTTLKAKSEITSFSDPTFLRRDLRRRFAEDLGSEHDIRFVRWIAGGIKAAI